VNVYPGPPTELQRYVKVSEVLRHTRPHNNPRPIDTSPQENKTSLRVMCDRMRQRDGKGHWEHSKDLTQLCWYAGSPYGPTISVKGTSGGFQGKVDPSKVEAYDFKPNVRITMVEEGGEEEKTVEAVKPIAPGDVVRINGLSTDTKFNGQEAKVAAVDKNGMVQVDLEDEWVNVRPEHYVRLKPVKKLTVSKVAKTAQTALQPAAPLRGEMPETNALVQQGVVELTDSDLINGKVHHPLTDEELLSKLPEPEWKKGPAKSDIVDDFVQDAVIDWDCKGEGERPLLLRSPLLDSCSDMDEETFPAMPEEFTCDPLTGVSVMRASPPLSWKFNESTNSKECTVKSWVLVLDDLINHKLLWVNTNIDKSARQAPVGVGGDVDAKFGVDLVNSFKYAGYEAPCFDEEGPRSYRFTLYGRPAASTHLLQTDKLTSSSIKALLVDSCVSAEIKFGVAAPHTDHRGSKLAPKMLGSPVTRK